LRENIEKFGKAKHQISYLLFAKKITFNYFKICEVHALIIFLRMLKDRERNTNLS
jgi:hypothetical protein